MCAHWIVARGVPCRLAFLGLLLLVQGPARAQAPASATTTAAAVENASPLRTAWGDPDLQGTWDFTTITPLQRPPEFAGREFLTDAEAAAIEREINQRRFENEEQSPGALGAAPRRADDPGIYNLGWWWEPEGRKLVGTRRTSLIVDPPDGRLPALTPHAQQILETREAARERAHRPEDLPLAERCVMGFNSGPPMVPGPYNNLVQLFQAPGYVVIVNEMVHDARIVPLDGRAHVDANIRLSMGDSRGRWEEATLVVETRNLRNDGTGTFGLPGVTGERTHLVERFTRGDDRTLLYEFTLSDPVLWTQPWSAEVPMRRIDGFVMEYACHEGNYGLANILAGARAEEREIQRHEAGR